MTSGGTSLIGLSIDASNDEIHALIGRGMRGDLARQRATTLSLQGRLGKLQSAKFECNNTVVCKTNLNDDMSVVMELKPERWKIFEVLPVEGKTTGTWTICCLQKVNSRPGLSVIDGSTRKAFSLSQSAKAKARLLRNDGCFGSIYTNVDGGHSYGPSILEVGVQQAWDENRFIEERFHKRSGGYAWNSNSRQLPMISKEVE